MTLPSLRGRAAVAGIGELKPTRYAEGRTVPHLMLEAARLAMLDARMRPADIDGLLVAPAIMGAPVTFASMMAEHLGLQPHYLDIVDTGGASAASQFIRAAAAVTTGLCQAVLCVTADALDPSTFYTRGATMMGLPAAEFERPYGPMGANSGYALIAQRHMYEFGTTSEQLAKVAVDQRTNACANPMAIFYGQPITIDDVLNSPLVVDPLHLLEIVMPCTGGAAFIVTTPERARESGHPVVALLGAGEACTHASITYRTPMTTSPIVESAGRAFEMAGVVPANIDLVSVYDCYTITVVITLEDAGFCEKGRGGPFVAEHDLTYRGDLPLNTHGGQLSFGQPGLAGGASHITEAVRQLRGEAGERQVPNCELAFVNGNGGILSEQASLVLGRIA
jgi:acetyl-CoA acetyltransferase